MKIAIATDHNGVEVKKEIKTFLKNKGHEVIDFSQHNSAIDDYPDYAFEVGKYIADGNADYGILLCGTGIGMSIAANKVIGVRCAHVSNTSEAILARNHNNANIIALGINNKVNDILKMVDLFINTDFKREERHIRRNNKIAEYENNR